MPKDVAKSLDNQEGSIEVYAQLFFGALANMLDHNGGSLQEALSELGIGWDSKLGKSIRDEFGWD
jgi:hypothetical protein